MNARLPIYSTGCPVSEGAGNAILKRRDLDEAFEEAAGERATEIVEEAIEQARKTGNYYKNLLSNGRMVSLSEIVEEAIGFDDESRSRFAELMLSPAAAPFLKAAGNWYANDNSKGIYSDYMESIHA